MPKETNLKDNEYAYIVNDVRDMYIEALEREQLHRYYLIGLNYYFYVDEYFKIIDETFNKHVWKFLR
jgi:hypothetical protein